MTLASQFFSKRCTSYQGNVSLPESLQVEQSIFKGPNNGKNSAFTEHLLRNLEKKSYLRKIRKQGESHAYWIQHMAMSKYSNIHLS
jgi:hypothetical protein